MAGAADPTAGFPCSGCRRRHLKCRWDAAGPQGSAPAACTRCALSGEPCVRGLNVRFKHYRAQSPPAEGQTWVDIPQQHQVSFIDETKRVQALYEASAGSDDREPSPVQLPVRSATTPWQSQRGESEQAADGGPGRRRTDSPEELRNRHDERHLSRRTPSALLPGCSLGLCNWGGSPLGSALPLGSWDEGRLLKYYVEYMCNWFDVCDTDRHFAIDVPRRAMSCPTLLNAIFALSSRHLSIQGRHCEEWVSNQYHQMCLRQLSSVTHDAQGLLNDDLLAATILLRTLEELEVPLLGTDNEGHLLGIQIFMNARGPSTGASSLRRAAFWVGLRQEITVAVARQRSIRISLDHAFIDQSLTPAGDDAWANRIIVHCAKVVRFCFGERRHRADEEHRALAAYDDIWLRARPSSFLPVAFCEPDAERGEVFPHILYLGHAVVIGVAHRLLARALLSCHDPTVPKAGPSLRAAQQAREEGVRRQVLQLCGTALSNESTMPAMITASLGVATCGDRFSSDVERAALLGVLVRTEVGHGWPTGGIQASLKAAWGWEPCA